MVLGFAVDDPVPALKAYANELAMNYPVLARDGTICGRHTGFTPKDRFERQDRELGLDGLDRVA